MNSCSIVIPTLNAEAHLKKNLAAIKKSAKDIPIVIIDSESTDNTVAFANEMEG